MKACYRNPVLFQECALKGRPAPGSSPEMGGWTQVSSTLAAVVGHQEGGAHSKVKRQIVLSANHHLLDKHTTHCSSGDFLSHSGVMTWPRHPSRYH